MIKLVKKGELRGIWVGDMKERDVGVIVNCACEDYLDTIVQRHKDSIIGIGSIYKWACVSILPRSFRVRLLEKGETLIVI